MGVIETVNVDPRSRVMASLTAKLPPIWPALLHSILELPMMGIDMAGSACTISKEEGQNFIFSVGQTHFVAFRASYRRMAAG
jgi:hypothetical protein